MIKTTLGEVGQAKSYNLSFMRFMAAIMVIVSHAFPLCIGNSENEWLVVATKGMYTMGGIAVSLFFLCSGYLIARTVQRGDSFGQFIYKRCVRLLLPLTFVTVGSIILGSFVSTLPVRQYFSNKDTWLYMLNAVMILKHTLPGVFLENIYTSTVNGSLWTLPVEFACYIVCFIVYKMKFFNNKRYILSIPMALVALYCIQVLSLRYPIIAPAIQACLLFYIGMSIWNYRDKIQLDVRYALLAMIIFVVLVSIGRINLAMIVAFPYVMFYVWFGIKQYCKKIGFLGDYSYALYLVAFPIQQTIVQIYGKMNPYVNMVIAIPVSLVCAVVVHWVTERR